jgi:hypothetical protein
MFYRSITLLWFLSCSIAQFPTGCMDSPASKRSPGEQTAAIADARHVPFSRRPKNYRRSAWPIILAYHGTVAGDMI